MLKQRILIACLVAVVLAGCAAGIPKDALVLTPESLHLRQMQTRTFESNDEGEILSACAALLQDMGFIIAESETDLGMILGTKNRSAVDAGQQVAAVFLALLGGGVMPTDKEQLMRASVVTRPLSGDRSGMAVRVTFQRVVWNTQNKITKQECLEDPEMYQAFFQKLSKSVFLEANQI
jgi:hypothetical protein